MARIARDARIETRDARAKIKIRHAPYWRTIHPGLAIGYRKGPRGGVWQVRYLRGTDYRFGTIGTADDHADADGITVLSYAQATRLALDYADQHEHHSDDRHVDLPQAGHYTVGQAMAAYMRRMKIESKSSGQTQRVVDAHILPALQDRPVAALTHTEIKRWLDRIATAPLRVRGKTRTRDIDIDDREAMRKRKATANRILTVLKAALNFAYEHGRVKSADAWRRVKPYRGVDAPKIRHLSTDECAALLRACEPDLRDLVRGALETGCRFGELAGMRTDDYSDGIVHVRESKSGRPRHVPLTAAGRDFFDDLTASRADADLIFTRADGEPWAKGLYIRPLRRACARAGIDPPASFHVLRHTYGSLLAAAGVPLHVIAAALGHADTRMTARHYAHLLPSYIADQIRQNLPDFDPDKK